MMLNVMNNQVQKKVVFCQKKAKFSLKDISLFNSFSTYMQYIENGGVQLQCPYFPTPQNLE